MTSTQGRATGFMAAALAWLLTCGVAAQQPPPTPQRPPQSPPPSAANGAEAKPPVKRVRANLAGFDLAPVAPTQSSTQIGGGTRSASGSDPVALAPVIGRCYSGAPAFAWTIGSRAQNFDFRLLDEAGAVVHHAAVSGRQYAYPPDAPPLQPGATYRWAVQPETSMLGGRSSRATVVRLSADEIAAVSAQLAQPPAGVAEAEWQAQVFTDRRLWYDAVAAWSALIDRFPDRAELHEKRGQVYDQLPVTQSLADEDYAAAARLRAGGR